MEKYVLHFRNSMNMSFDTHKKMMSVYSLLEERTISISAFEHIHTILKGIHPKLDQKLEICSKALNKLQKLQKGDVVTLYAEGLPDDTEEKRKRKRTLLFFISSLKNLKSEIKRIDEEFQKNNDHSFKNQADSWSRIIGSAKGPFGIITLIALVIVAVSLLQRNNKMQNNPPATQEVIVSPSTNPALPKLKIIMYNGKQIPRDQLYVGSGLECDGPHYHATTGMVQALDQTTITDPGGCGYGKTKDVQVIEVAISISP